MTILFSDDFNRNTGLGSNWLARGPGGTNWVIKGDTHVATTNNPSQDDVLVHTTAAYGTADYSVSCLFNSSSASLGGICGRRVNFGTADNNCYILFAMQGGPGTLALYKRVSGGYTQLATTAVNLGSNTLKLQMQGSGASQTITAFVDGTQQLQVVDNEPALTAAGTGGLQAYGDADGDFVQWDNFLVEDFVTATPVSTALALPWESILPGAERGLRDPLLFTRLQQPPRGGIYV